MLKVVSESHWDEVFDFVVHYKNAMSQTTLRYAIEKIPTYLRIYPYRRNNACYVPKQCLAFFTKCCSIIGVYIRNCIILQYSFINVLTISTKKLSIWMHIQFYIHCIVKLSGLFY